MSAFYAMARSREITALRSAGVGLRRMLVLPDARCPSCWPWLQLALSQWLVPIAEQSLKSWWDSTIPLEERSARAALGAYQQRRADCSSATAPTAARCWTWASTPGRRMGCCSCAPAHDERDWAGNDWLLRGVTELAISGTAPPVDMERTRHWSSNLRPEDVLQLDVAEPHLSGAVLADVIVRRSRQHPAPQFLRNGAGAVHSPRRSRSSS